MPPEASDSDSAGLRYGAGLVDVRSSEHAIPRNVCVNDSFDAGVRDAARKFDGCDLRAVLPCRPVRLNLYDDRIQITSRE
jgi:hypothetical protein